MKLTTKEGQLELPQDFGINMVRTNPLMGNEGDSSDTTTLPSTPRNLAILGHRERIDRSERYTNKVDATMQCGPVTKNGNLVMDTACRRGGIAASFAINNGDLYSKSKDKTLKEIMGSYKEDFNSIRDAVAKMEGIFNSGDTTGLYDYTIFPVAVSPYEYTDPLTGEKSMVYQLNNEIFFNGGDATLVYEAREVHEGDIMMAVPDGYGVAPFLKLHALLRVLFSQMGYTMTANCFASSPFDAIVIVHNCSDALCGGSLYYRDMVPSCTLATFLDWMLAKFHARPVVDSETMTVKVVMMEDMLGSGSDVQWADKVEGDWTVMMQPQKRIILNPKTQGDDEGIIENDDEDSTALDSLTKPAARTLNGLVQKYGFYVEADENEFASLETTNPAYLDCLVMRKATGIFYKLFHRFEPVLTNYYIVSAGEWLQIPPQKAVKIGSDHFTYDRYNSDESEDFQQDDTIPLMIVGIFKPDAGTMDTLPYIGQRIHYNTAYEGKKEDEEQPIIVCQKAYNSNFFYNTTGTTQAWIPYTAAVSGATGETLLYSLTNYSMYDLFWRHYNELLLNQAPHVKGRLLLGVGDFINADISRPKVIGGQPLLPVRMEAKLTDRIGITEMEAVVVKQFDDQISDSTISPRAGSGWSTGWIWRITNDAARQAELVMYDLWLTDPQDAWELLDYLVLYGDKVIDLGQPTAAGQSRVVERQFEMQLKVHIRGAGRDYTRWLHKDGVWDEDNAVQISEYDFSQYLAAVTITSTFLSHFHTP